MRPRTASYGRKYPLAHLTRRLLDLAPIPVVWVSLPHPAPSSCLVSGAVGRMYRTLVKTQGVPFNMFTTKSCIPSARDSRRRVQGTEEPVFNALQAATKQKRALLVGDSTELYICDGGGEQAHTFCPFFFYVFQRQETTVAAAAATATAEAGC